MKRLLIHKTSNTVYDMPIYRYVYCSWILCDFDVGCLAMALATKWRHEMDGKVKFGRNWQKAAILVQSK